MVSGGRLPRWLVAASLLLAPLVARADDPELGRSAEARALAFLAQEVPRWASENRCYSCHNNGDAARALYDAARRRLDVPPEALADTTRWLERPEGWDHNGGDGPFSDKRLARLQFAAALRDALASGRSRDRLALTRAARRLADDQADDGSWPLDDAGSIGSPATYGRPLATLSARDTLRAADPRAHRDRIARADHWLARLEIKTVLDASTVLLASATSDDPALRSRRDLALDVLRRGQSDDGGWGPYLHSPPEPFDTALALLALASIAEAHPEVTALIRRGRSFLLAHQSPDGGWPATTRPPGSDSYAQRLSTTGWAALALLATRDLP